MFSTQSMDNFSLPNPFRTVLATDSVLVIPAYFRVSTSWLSVPLNLVHIYLKVGFAQFDNDSGCPMFIAIYSTVKLVAVYALRQIIIINIYRLPVAICLFKKMFALESCFICYEELSAMMWFWFIADFQRSSDRDIANRVSHWNGKRGFYSR